jgi:hypothetical protein
LQDEGQREAFARIAPAAYTPNCRTPYLVLGSTSELDEASAKAVLTAFADDVTVARGRLSTGAVWGATLSPRSKGAPSPLGMLARVKVKRPSAELLCTMPIPVE